jgi:CRISPR-associated protein Cas1
MRRRPLHVVGHDAVVGVCGGRLEVRRDGAVVASAPLLGVSEVVLTGYVTVTTPALHRLLRDDVPVVLLAGDGRARGRLEPPASSHAECRRRQLAISGNEPWRLAISRRIVSAKLANQARMLSLRAGRSSDPPALRHTAEALRDAEIHAAAAEELDELRGIEGAATRRYFAALRRVLEQLVPEFQRRDRAGGDVVNALLNYCSALLRETVVTAVLVAGLDPGVGILHASYRRRPALALDLMEEWRSVLLERTVVTLVTRRQITNANLVATPQGPRLDADARRAAVARFQQRLQATHRTHAEAAKRTFRDHIDHQAVSLRDCVMERRTGYEAFRWH